MPESKRPEPKRRSPASRPGRAGDSVPGRPRKSAAARRGQTASRAMPRVVQPIKQAMAESAEQRSDQRLGLTARRAAIQPAGTPRGRGRHRPPRRPVPSPPAGCRRVVDPADLDAVARQLGREPRGVLDIAYRCPNGEPGVVKTAPKLPDGTPFPTLYYLT